MSQLIAKPSLPDRMLRAARLDISLYNEVEADLNATSQALTVVVLAAVASGIGAALTLGTAGRPNGAIAALVGGVIAELVGWAVWSYVMYFVGTRLFHGTATYGELLRPPGNSCEKRSLNWGRIVRFPPRRSCQQVEKRGAVSHACSDHVRRH